MSLQSLLCNGPADLQAEAIAAQVSPGSHLTLQLPATSLLHPSTLFTSLTTLNSISLELRHITDCRWLSDLFHFLPAFTSLLNLSLTDFLRGPPELSMLLHSLSKLSTLTALTLSQASTAAIQLPRAIQTPLLPSLPALRCLHLCRVPTHLLGYTSVDLLSRDLTLSAALSSLHLTHSTVPPADLHPLLCSLSSLPALHTLCIDHARYLAHAAMPLLDSLSRLTACDSLSLAGITAADPGQSITPLRHPPSPGSRDCFHPPSLTHLDLGDQPLSGNRRSTHVDVAYVLLQQLSSSAAPRGLRSLRLHGHRITSAAAGSLLACLERAAAPPLLRLEAGPMTGSTVEAGPRLAAALTAQTSLTRLSLVDTVLEPAQLAAVLRELVQLRSLSVHCARRVVVFDPPTQRMWDAGVALGAADALSRLTHLTALSSNWPHAIPADDTAFPDALACLQSLRELRLEHCEVSEGAGECLAAAVGRLTALQSLQLERCGLFKDRESTAALAQALRRMPGVTRVRLLGKAVTDVRDVEAIVRGLRGAWGLRELALAVQEIPMEDMVGLAQELPCQAELLQMRCGGWDSGCSRRSRR